MNTTWSDVQDLLDLVDHVWIGLVLIAVAAVPSYFSARNHKTIQQVDRKADAIRDQVVNSHPETNLRDDLDRAIASINAIGHELRGLRKDLLAEEDHRRQQIADLRGELEHRTGKHRRLP